MPDFLILPNIIPNLCLACLDVWSGLAGISQNLLSTPPAARGVCHMNPTGPGMALSRIPFFFIFSPPGDSGDGGLAGQHDSSSKVGLWLCREPRTRDLPWDTSSTDSGGCEREERKIPRKPALVRTRTERVSLFDEFFDRDF